MVSVFLQGKKLSKSDEDNDEEAGDVSDEDEAKGYLYIFIYYIFILNLCLTKGCKSPEEESPTRGSSRRGSLKPEGSSRSPSLKGAKKKKVSKKY